LPLFTRYSKENSFIDAESSVKFGREGNTRDFGGGSTACLGINFMVKTSACQVGGAKELISTFLKTGELTGRGDQGKETLAGGNVQLLQGAKKWGTDRKEQETRPVRPGHREWGLPITTGSTKGCTLH